jgi:flagellar basal body-associated protein FliL
VVSTAVAEEDSKEVKTDKKNFVSVDLKNKLIMVLVALISVVCSFIFVSKKVSTSFEQNDFEAQDVNSVSAVERTEDISQRDTDVKLKNKEDKNDKIATDKVTTKKIKTDNVNGAGTGKSNTDNIDNDEDIGAIQNQIVVPMENFVVNLGGVSSNRYLRVQISLEVDNENAQKKINEKMVIMRDKMISFFATKTAKDVETEGGLFKLRLEIKDSLNKLLGSSDMVKQIYFSDFIVQ